MDEIREALKTINPRRVVMNIPKCYRVWFSNGSAVLVDAMSADNAKEIAFSQAKKDGYSVRVSKVECLDD